MAVAVLRMESNDDIREDERDRGEAKNLLNDLQGAVGELAARLKLERDLAGMGKVVDGPLLSNRPVDDVDVLIHGDGPAVRLEAKCLLWSPEKRLFLVNKKAHARSIRRRASGYIPVIARAAGGVAVVGGVIPIDDVHKWELIPFSFGDPALALSLEDCTERYFGKPWSVVKGYLGNPGKGGIEEAVLMQSLPEALLRKKPALTALLTKPAGSIETLCHAVACLAP